MDPSIKRRVLCLFPVYSPSFGTFEHAYPLMGVSAFMPPQGLLLIAAYLPDSFEVRFVDENMTEATAGDFAWADIVFVSGMHIQAEQIRNAHRRAVAYGKVTVLGGPSVSGDPDAYPDFHYLHIGEIGDATDALIARLSNDLAIPTEQVRLTTSERVPLADLPTPAYHLVDLGQYLIGSIQFSSGCPYRCEFCDIPQLYGRQPRLKTPKQIVAELDAIIAQRWHPGVVYFVDDNFIGNKKAARDLLPHLVEWQKSRGYPVQFACEATLNLAKQPEILALMREALFTTVFVGIETPEVTALERMDKRHNATMPMMEAIETINSYGLEITSGIILGLDTDTDDTEMNLRNFIERSKIPILTINLLQALPKTPLWDRLERAGRLRDDPALESNVAFLRPYESVVGAWQRSIAFAYAPDALFDRFDHQIRTTFQARMAAPVAGKLTRANLSRAFNLAVRIVYYLGIRADYRARFWRSVALALRHGQVEAIFTIGFVAHHVIQFAREANRGEQDASFYATRARRDAVPVSSALVSEEQLNSPRLESSP